MHHFGIHGDRHVERATRPWQDSRWTEPRTICRRAVPTAAMIPPAWSANTTQNVRKTLALPARRRTPLVLMAC
jgi:hypothetical protein